MKYNDPELIERLSAEYVLGTLSGKARDRFEGLMEKSQQIRTAVWKWETLLVPLANMEPPADQPYHLWPEIKSRISGKAIIPIPTQASVKRKKRKSADFSSLWRWWGVTATAAAMFLAIVLTTSPPPATPSTIDSVALFSDQDAEPQWLVSFDMKSGQLKAKAVNEIALEAGKAFELWVLPEQGTPRSLGLLPVSAASQSSSDLPLALIQLLTTANGLAVSIEPQGGSPTGLPTGPVAYQAKIIQL